MSKQSRARAALRAAPTRLPPGGPNAFFVRWGAILAGCIVVLAALAVYHQSFSGPFILDDEWSITSNPTIHRLGSALSPPPDKGTAGRPLLNLTFALNYRQGRL